MKGCGSKTIRTLEKLGLIGSLMKTLDNALYFDLAKQTVLCCCDLPLKILDLKTAITLEGKEKEEGSSSKKTKKSMEESRDDSFVQGSTYTEESADLIYHQETTMRLNLDANR